MVNYTNSRNQISTNRAKQHETFEKAFHRSGQGVASILEMMRDGYIAIDRSWKLIYFNRAAAQIMQFNPSTTLHRFIWDLCPELKQNEFYTRIKEALVEGKITRFHTYYPSAERWLEVTAHPAPTLISLYLRDITKLKQNDDSPPYAAQADQAQSDPAINGKNYKHVLIKSDLPYALKRDQLHLYYQPLIDIKEQRIAGTEALLRWRHPRLGLIRPDHFLPEAEQYGLMTEIGSWVLQQACQQAKRWQANGLPELKILINVSAKQFQEDHLLHAVRQALERSALQPSYVNIEITESMLLAHDQKALDTLHQLKAWGCKISIDDFGTHYASFHYLKYFPIDIIKIDRTFITELTNQSKDQHIVKSIIDLCHRLGIRVIAEGVEHEQQLTWLKQNGCDMVQGYLFSSPLPPTRLSEWLKHPPRDLV